MEEYVTIFEAILRTGLSDSTIRRALKNGKIRALPGKPGEPHLIPVSELDKLKPGDDSALTRQRLSTIEQRLDELAQELHDLRIVYASKLLETMPEEAQPPQGRAQSVKSTIPDGYVLVRYFNQLHDMKDTSIHRRVHEGIIEVTRGEWQQGRTRVTQLLSPAQQRQYYLALRNYPGFVECEHCPHE